MRFALATTDRHLPALEALLEAGWRPVKLYSAPQDGVTDRIDGLAAMALRLGVPLHLGRIDDSELDGLSERGCEILITSIYRWRIPAWEGRLPYAINLHPSPLPLGRGPYPQVRAILEAHPRWGVTAHKIAPEFDAGDILDSETFELAADESHETLNLRLSMATRRLMERILTKGVGPLWLRAKPQGDGEYWPRWSDADRALNFDAPVADILRRVRAFGLLETMAQPLGQSRVFVRQAHGWVEPHGHAPGTLVHHSRTNWVVAAADGYVALMGWSPVSAGLIRTMELGRLVS